VQAAGEVVSLGLIWKMEEDPGANPYSPPAVDSGPVLSATERGPLKDPRILGGIAVAGAGVLCAGILAIQIFSIPGLSGILDEIRPWVFLGTMLVYFWWLARCAKNTAIIDRLNSTGPVWALACHFVPLANWFMPCLVLRQIAKTTFKYRPAAGTEHIVIAWWFTLVLAVVVAGMVPAEGPPGVTARLAALGILGALLLAFVCFAYVIVRVSSAQAAFRWSDVPESARSIRVPLSGPRMLPHAKTMGLPPRRGLPPKPLSSFPPMRPPQRTEATGMEE
jgi:hypothetical protein